MGKGHTRQGLVPASTHPDVQLLEGLRGFIASGRSEQALGLLSGVEAQQALWALELAGRSLRSPEEVSRCRHLRAAVLVEVDPLAALAVLREDEQDPGAPESFRLLAGEKLKFISENELELMDAAGRASGGWRHGFPYN